MRLCESCRHKDSPPQELVHVYTEMRKYFPRVFYCSKLQVIRVYDQSSPAKLFDCEHYEPSG